MGAPFMVWGGALQGWQGWDGDSWTAWRDRQGPLNSKEGWGGAPGWQGGRGRGPWTARRGGEGPLDGSEGTGRGPWMAWGMGRGPKGCGAGDRLVGCAVALSHAGLSAGRALLQARCESQHPAFPERVSFQM